jgi:hypothetical protein
MGAAERVGSEAAVAERLTQSWATNGFHRLCCGAHLALFDSHGARKGGASPFGGSSGLCEFLPFLHMRVIHTVSAISFRLLHIVSLTAHFFWISGDAT